MASNFPAGRAVLDAPPRLLGGEARIEQDLQTGEQWIVLTDALKEERLIGPRPDDLVFDLDAVRDPDDARAYVRRWGVLFHGPADMPHGGAVREAWGEWAKAIRAIATIVTLTTLVRRAHAGNGETLAELRGGLPQWSEQFVEDVDFLRRISVDVQHRVNAVLSLNPWAIDAEPFVRPDGDPTVFYLAARPPNTLAYAYFLIADLLNARAPIERCAGCGLLFRPGHGNQRYHDKACSSHARYRTWRDHKGRRTGRQEGERR